MLQSSEKQLWNYCESLDLLIYYNFFIKVYYARILSKMQFNLRRKFSNLKVSLEYIPDELQSPLKIKCWKHFVPYKVLMTARIFIYTFMVHNGILFVDFKRNLFMKIQLLQPKSLWENFDPIFYKMLFWNKLFKISKISVGFVNVQVELEGHIISLILSPSTNFIVNYLFW